MKVLLLCGGRSAEHLISIESAEYIRSVLIGGRTPHSVNTIEIDADGRWLHEGRCVQFNTGTGRWKLFDEDTEIIFDIVFPVLHGPYGEDGTIQGLCMIADWPCAGTGVMGSAVAMNKITCKQLLRGSDIQVVPWISFNRDSGYIDACEQRVPWYPCFVKPARLGSSVGISKVDCPAELRSAMDLAFNFDSLILVEKEIKHAREIEVGVVGDSDGIRSSIPGEISPGGEWYDYRAKYLCEDSELIIPAPLDEPTTAGVRKHAELAFSLLGGRGYARADFLLSSRDGIFLNEVNTIPGFTKVSMFLKLWEASGVHVDLLLNRIMADSLERSPVGLAERWDP